MAGSRRRLSVAILAGLIALPACGAAGDTTRLRVAADWVQPPTTGANAVAALRLTAATGQPVSGARLEARAFMSHPGMAPVTATVEEQGDGIYRAHFHFTMAGDWTIRVTGSIPDGRMVDQPLAVTTVRAAHGQ